MSFFNPKKEAYMPIPFLISVSDHHALVGGQILIRQAVFWASSEDQLLEQMTRYAGDYPFVVADLI